MRLAARTTLILLTTLLISSEPSIAEVVRVEVEERQDVLDGKSFGEPGAYEKLAGKIHFAFDPKNPMNARIVNIDKAPINEEGRVEAWADFMVLRPKDASRGSGVGFVEVSNRGGKASLRYFNRAGRGVDPVEEADFGDALLMRQGLTVIWVGWQFDVPEREHVLRLHVPVAKDGRKSIQGLVRCDWTVDQTVTTLGLGHRNHTPYALVDPKHKENILTERDGRLSPRRTVPRDQWRFAREEDGQVVDSNEHIYMASGFQAGKIYELVYRAKDPSVVGLGPAAIRDVMSYAKYDEESLFPVEHGVAFGVSQTGRFLRHFIYQGFNTDEKKRKVYDGLLIHTAGAGRGSFNHRFGQPSRDAHRYSAFFYPTDIFPFTSWTQRDPETGQTDGLFAHMFDPAHLPKVFYTNTGYEYWGRAASLIHTQRGLERRRRAVSQRADLSSRQWATFRGPRFLLLRRVGSRARPLIGAIRWIFFSRCDPFWCRSSNGSTTEPSRRHRPTPRSRRETSFPSIAFSSQRSRALLSLV